MRRCDKNAGYDSDVTGIKYLYIQKKERMYGI